MTLVVHVVRTVVSAKFICCCWRNPWCDLTSHTHRNAMRQSKYGQIIDCSLTILIVSLFSLCRLRNTTQLRSGTVDKSKWPVFLQNASDNPITTSEGAIVHTVRCHAFPFKSIVCKKIMQYLQSHGGSCISFEGCSINKRCEPWCSWWWLG